MEATWDCRLGLLLMKIRILLIAGALVVSGCAGVTDPTIEWQSWRHSANQDAAFPTLSEALRYTERGMQAYESAVDNHILFNQLTGSALILLLTGTSAALINNVDTDLVATLSAGAAGVFGASTYLTSPSRPLMYAAGYDALVCARRIALSQVRVSNRSALAEETINAFLESLADLQVSRVELEIFQRRLEPLVGTEHTDNAFDVVGTRLAALKGLIRDQQHGNDLARALALEPKLNGLAEALVSAVDQIRGKVNRAIGGTVSDLQSIPGVLSGIPTAAQARAVTLAQLQDANARLTGAFSNTAPETNALIPPDKRGDPSAAEKAKRKKQYTLFYEQLNTALMIAQQRSDAFIVAREGLRTVAASADDATLEVPMSIISSCGINLDTAGIAISPTNVVFDDDSKQDKQRVSFAGGNERYIIGFEGAAPDKISIRQELSHGPVAIITKEANAGAGTHTVVVRDSANKYSKRFTIEVKATEQPQTGSQNGTTKPTCATGELMVPEGPEELLQELDPAADPGDLKKLQFRLGLKADGLLGCGTRAAMRAALGTQQGDLLTVTPQALKDALKGDKKPASVSSQDEATQVATLTALNQRDFDLVLGFMIDELGPFESQDTATRLSEKLKPLQGQAPATVVANTTFKQAVFAVQQIWADAVDAKGAPVKWIKKLPTGGIDEATVDRLKNKTARGSK